MKRQNYISLNKSLSYLFCLNAIILVGCFSEQKNVDYTISFNALDVPDTRNNKLYLKMESNSWTIVKFNSYVQVSEVFFLYNNENKAVSVPLKVGLYNDSEPVLLDDILAMVDLYSKKFQTRKEAETFIVMNKFEEELWIKDLILDYKKLTSPEPPEPRL